MPHLIMDRDGLIVRPRARWSAARVIGLALVLLAALALAGLAWKLIAPAFLLAL